MPVLHGLLPHYSLPQTRQVYAIHTISSRATYSKDNLLQRDMVGVKGFKGPKYTLHNS